MRCLTLADELARRGAKIRFVCRKLPDELRELLQAARHYEFSQLHGVHGIIQHDELRHAQWLEASQAQDAQDTVRALQGAAWGWLVVDHYALDERWERNLRLCVKHILVIDDIADRRHECDVLLDQNYYAGMEMRYQQLLPKNARRFLGPAYALLRDEFRQARMAMQARDGKVRRLLVMFGGADADNLTGQTMQVLAAMNLPETGVDVVVSRQHPQREQIGEICRRKGFNFHVQPPNLAQLMAAADMAIGAGGVTMWERCCLGLPCLVICAAQNQRLQIDDAVQAGLVAAAANPDELAVFLRQQVPALMADADTCKLLAQNGMRMVDGLGAARIAAYMRGSLMQIRQAILQDAGSVHEWRNHPRVQAVSRNSGKIEYDAHLAWFSAVLADPDRPLLIGELEGSAVGVVRFDIQNEAAEVSLYLVQREENSGLGLSLLLYAEKWLRQNRPQVQKINATVLAGNEPSEKLFRRAGYRMEDAVMTKMMDDHD